MEEKKIEFFCYDNSELAEEEALNKGYRIDIFVKINQEYFSIFVYDIVRLNQDYELEIDQYGFFQIPNNIIIVKDLYKSTIKETIEKLIKQNYFDNVKPASNNYKETLLRW